MADFGHRFLDGEMTRSRDAPHAPASYPPVTHRPEAIVFHLLTTIGDAGVFSSHRRSLTRTNTGTEQTEADSSTPIGASGTASVDSRPLLSVTGGPRHAAVWPRPILCCGVLSIAVVLGSITAEGVDAQSVTAAASRQAKIANALTAAPEEVTRNASVKDWPAKEGEGLALLRQGTNGWVCLPDNLTTPGNDPMCMDATFHDAVAGHFAGQVPKVTRVGYAYMLTSDAEGSNIDPTASAPTPTNQWHHAGPHIMILYPDATLLEGLPTQPSTYGPYVMFAGTPIAHVMLPVQSGYAHSASHNAGVQKTAKRP